MHPDSTIASDQYDVGRREAAKDFAHAIASSPLTTEAKATLVRSLPADLLIDVLYLAAGVQR